jgi:hypothetical protein
VEDLEWESDLGLLEFVKYCEEKGLAGRMLQSSLAAEVERRVMQMDAQVLR